METQFWKSNPLSFFDLILIKISLFFLVKITLSFKCKYLKWLRAFMSKIDYSLNKNIRGDKFSNMRSISSLLTNYFLSRRCCSFQGLERKIHVKHIIVVHYKYQLPSSQSRPSHKILQFSLIIVSIFHQQTPCLEGHGVVIISSSILG